MVLGRAMLPPCGARWFCQRWKVRVVIRVRRARRRLVVMGGRLGLGWRWLVAIGSNS